MVIATQKYVFHNISPASLFLFFFISSVMLINLTSRFDQEVNLVVDMNTDVKRWWE